MSLMVQNHNGIKSSATCLSSSSSFKIHCPCDNELDFNHFNLFGIVQVPECKSLNRTPFFFVLMQSVKPNHCEAAATAATELSDYSDFIQTGAADAAPTVTVKLLTAR